MTSLKPVKIMKNTDLILINKYPRVGDFVMDVNGRVYKVFDCITPTRFAGYCYQDEREYDLSIHTTKVIGKAKPNPIAYPSLFDTIVLPEDPWPLDLVYYVVDVDSTFNYAISNGREKKFCVDSQSIISLSTQITTNLSDADITGII